MLLLLLLLLVRVQAALDDALHGLADVLEDGHALAVGQVGQVVASAVVVLDGRRAQLDGKEQQDGRVSTATGGRRNLG